MKKSNPWETSVKKTVTKTKHLLANLSIKVRTDQFSIFRGLVRPKRNEKVLDIGATSNETLKDSNMFEKLYKWPDKLTAATIENEKELKRLYPEIKTVKIKPGRSLPFKDDQFDIVVSWATLEHVGGLRSQKEFLEELLRVGKKIFVTTPYRGALYEPHTGFFFLHWLSLSWFRKICKITGREFWSTAKNLNPLFVRDVKKMDLSRELNVKIYRTFKVLPSHILIFG